MSRVAMTAPRSMLGSRPMTGVAEIRVSMRTSEVLASTGPATFGASVLGWRPAMVEPPTWTAWETMLTSKPTTLNTVAGLPSKSLKGLAVFRASPAPTESVGVMPGESRPDSTFPLTEIAPLSARSTTSSPARAEAMVILPAAESTATSPPANTSPVWIELAAAFSAFRLISLWAVTDLPGPVASCSAAVVGVGSGLVASATRVEATWAVPNVSFTSGARPAATLPVIAMVWALRSMSWPVSVEPTRVSAAPDGSGSAGSWVWPDCRSPEPVIAPASARTAMSSPAVTPPRATLPVVALMATSRTALIVEPVARTEPPAVICTSRVALTVPVTVAVVDPPMVTSPAVAPVPCVAAEPTATEPPVDCTSTWASSAAPAPVAVRLPPVVVTEPVVAVTSMSLPAETAPVTVADPVVAVTKTLLAALPDPRVALGPRTLRSCDEAPEPRLAVVAPLTVMSPAAVPVPCVSAEPTETEPPVDCASTWASPTALVAFDFRSALPASTEPVVAVTSMSSPATAWLVTVAEPVVAVTNTSRAAMPKPRPALGPSTLMSRDEEPDPSVPPVAPSMVISPAAAPVPCVAAEVTDTDPPVDRARTCASSVAPTPVAVRLAPRPTTEPVVAVTSMSLPAETVPVTVAAPVVAVTNTLSAALPDPRLAAGPRTFRSCDEFPDPRLAEVAPLTVMSPAAVPVPCVAAEPTDTDPPVDWASTWASPTAPGPPAVRLAVVAVTEPVVAVTSMSSPASTAPVTVAAPVVAVTKTSRAALPEPRLALGPRTFRSCDEWPEPSVAPVAPLMVMSPACAPAPWVVAEPTDTEPAVDCASTWESSGPDPVAVRVAVAAAIEPVVLVISMSFPAVIVPVTVARPVVAVTNTLSPAVAPPRVAPGPITLMSRPADPLPRLALEPPLSTTSPARALAAAVVTKTVVRPVAETLEPLSWPSEIAPAGAVTVATPPAVTSPMVTAPVVADTVAVPAASAVVALRSPEEAVRTRSPVGLIEAPVARLIVSIWISESEAARSTLSGAAASTKVASTMLSPRAKTKLPALITAPGEMTTPPGE